MTAIVGATLQLNKLAVLDGAGREFAQTSYGSKSAFLVPFALFKAACNLLVGGLADRHGRKPIALFGSVVGLVPPVMVLAASGAGDGSGWPAFVASAAFLGVHQGVTWTCCILITMDLCGPRARGSPAASPRPWVHVHRRLRRGVRRARTRLGDVRVGGGNRRVNRVPRDLARRVRHAG